jgi:monoamine oxidase
MITVVIIGAGLSGLICAKRLLQGGSGHVNIHVLEARGRFGGRMYQEGGVDLGATWSWPSHDSALMREVHNLGVGLEPQASKGIAIAHQSGMLGQQAGTDLSPSGDGSTRFENGAASIIERLVEELKSSERVTFSLNSEVTAIARKSQDPLSYDITSTSTSSCNNEGVTDASSTTIISAHVVILALPPQLSSALSFSPPLPAEKVAAMQRTPTWMADTGKVRKSFSFL